MNGSLCLLLRPRDRPTASSIYVSVLADFSGHGERVDRGRVEHVDLVAGSGERDVEHALDTDRVHLAGREGDPGMTSLSHESE